MFSIKALKMTVVTGAFILLAAILPLVTQAQTILRPDNQISGALGAIVSFIQGVLIPFLFAVGFFMFVWGIIKFFVIGGSNDDAKKEGKSLIIYALAGFVVILIFWGLVNILAQGIGLQNETLINTPGLPTPK
jgi:hypothetical protein